jgi:16S rRNA (guanine966-N2)-methyltransferase
MRVIAGSAKGHALKAPKSTATRPTSDKVRGAVFAMLDAKGVVGGARVLDLYAGTGALGVEALSRGAAWCDFVESDRTACRTIAENLEHTRLGAKAKVHARSVEQVLAHPQTIPPHSPNGVGYDIILLDPPYDDAGTGMVLERLAASPLVRRDGVVVLEHSKRSAVAEAYGDLHLLKTRRHGDTCISMFHVSAAESAPEHEA